jgi:hypothetical protein
MTPRAATCALIAVALLFTAGAPAPRAAGEAAVDNKKVTITLKTSDKARGLSLEAKKSVAQDTNAFDAVRHTVAMAYKTDPDRGPIVTSLCVVAAAQGRWLVGAEQKFDAVGAVH